ncbi:hypothetical protein BC830DRAFT_1229576 [Chytriomyces sp. MP71]|nr:hypothetical protein BC830DRAFT_1229576 [Chytriomyces sp. MP71]
MRQYLVPALTVLTLLNALALFWEMSSSQSAPQLSSTASLFTPANNKSFANPVPFLRPTVLYFNTHSGTRANFKMILKRLEIEFNEFDPNKFGYGMNSSMAQKLIGEGLAKEVCNKADIVIVSDTCSHSRFLLETFLDKNPNNHCRAKIAIELTNRFDWGFNKDEDRESYRKLLWLLATRFPRRVYFAANNALESRHFTDATLATPPFRILRPIGYSDVPADEVSTKDAEMAMIRTLENSPILTYLNDMGLKYKHVVQGAGQRYGGPKTAAKYRAFVEFPYQASTMKLYEHIAAGVVMLVPSPRFYFELQKAGFFSTPDMQTSLLYQGKNWTKYHDYYNDAMKAFLYYFDSFEELKTMLQKDVDTRGLREKGPAAYKKIADETVYGWADMFLEMGFAHLSVDGEVYKGGRGVKVFREKLREGLQPVTEESQWKAMYEKGYELMRATEKAEWDAIEVKVKLPPAKNKDKSS